MTCRRCISLFALIMAFGMLVAAPAWSQSAKEIFGIDDPVPAVTIDIQKSVSTNDEKAVAALKAEWQALIAKLDRLIKEAKEMLAKANGTTTQPPTTTTTTTTTTTNPPATTTTKPPATNSSSRTYTVLPGDYLIKIAQKTLGNGNRWMELVELNKDRYPSLLKNPNLIYPGWELKIPGSGTATLPPTSTPPTTTTPGTESAELAAWKGGKLSPAEFCRLLGPVAQASSRKTGIPASVILAQAACETGWGKATIGDAKNLFGIKGTGPAGSITVSTQEWENGRYVTIRAAFRKYHTWQESIDDHAKLLTGASRYKNCFNYKNNPDQFCRELQKAGYATSPTYAQTLISIMKSNNMYKWNI